MSGVNKPLITASSVSEYIEGKMHWFTLRSFITELREVIKARHWIVLLFDFKMEVLTLLNSLYWLGGFFHSDVYLGVVWTWSWVRYVLRWLSSLFGLLFSEMVDDRYDSFLISLYPGFLLALLCLLFLVVFLYRCREASPPLRCPNNLLLDFFVNLRKLLYKFVCRAFVDLRKLRPSLTFLPTLLDLVYFLQAT